jgi:flagellar hook-length control protein FliK
MRGDVTMSLDSQVLPELGPFTGELHEQLIRAVRLQWHQGIGDARVRLRPEHLGDVAIELRVERGAVTVSLRAETPAAAESIRSHDAELRAALDAQGLKVEKFEVLVDPDGRRRQQAQDHPDPPAPKRRPSSNLPRFEVVV